jgi:hypothetical protein
LAHPYLPQNPRSEGFVCIFHYTPAGSKSQAVWVAIAVHYLVSVSNRKEVFYMLQNDSAVVVTAAQERARPALGKLARACIALARREVAARTASAAAGSAQREKAR